MEDPARILDDGNEWARELVGSARMDVPSDQFRRRLARRLGVASGAVGLSAAGSAKAVTAGIWFKWMVIGGAAGVLTIGGITAAVAPPEARSTAGSATRAPATQPTRDGHVRSELGVKPFVGEAVTPSLAIPTSLASTSPERSMEMRTDGSGAHSTSAGGARLPLNRHKQARSIAPPASTSDPEAAATPNASATASTTLIEELALINSVRAALAKKAASDALRSLDDYAAKYPNGRLRMEALVLRVTALAESGERSSAKLLADQLLATHPDSPYAQRLRALTHSGTEQEP